MINLVVNMKERYLIHIVASIRQVSNVHSSNNNLRSICLKKVDNRIMHVYSKSPLFTMSLNYLVNMSLGFRQMDHGWMGTIVALNSIKRLF